MYRILFFLILVLFTACTQQQLANQQIQDHPEPVIIDSAQAQAKVIDTIYQPLQLALNKLDTITVKRVYYNKNLAYYHEAFFLNGEKIYVDTSHVFIYESNYNRVFKNKGHTFLFLATDDKPNSNAVSAYELVDRTLNFVTFCTMDESIKATFLKDIDNDGNAEFGGFGLTEQYTNADSMYYNPSAYYEIKNGKILFDTKLVKKEDKKENGVYLKNPLDKDGYCCVIVKIPTNKRKK
jgi:hypothetical protein